MSSRFDPLERLTIDSIIAQGGEKRKKEVERLEIPKSPDIEASIIGAMLSSPEALSKMAALTPDDFYEQQNRLAWQAITQIVQKGQTPDPIMVKEISDGKISMTHLLTTLENACIISSIDYYTQKLRDVERARRLYIASHRAASAISDGEDIDKIEAQLVESMMQRTAGEETGSIDKEVDVDELLTGRCEQPYCTFGIRDIDKATGGIRVGEVCILAARSSVGKSALAITAAVESASVGWKTLYASYEMSRRQLWYRMVSYQGRVPLRKFRDMSFSEADKIAIRKARQELEPVFKRIRANTSANTPGALSKLIRMEQLSGGAEFVIIDHAGRMMTDGSTKGDYSKMSDIANRIKDIAINLNVPILLLWQLNRSVEQRADKRPTLADLRDSGQAEEVADIVLLLSRDSYNDRSIQFNQATITVDVAKSRDGGQLGEMQMPWTRMIGKQTDIRESWQEIKD